MRTTVLQHWGGPQMDEGRKGDKRPLGEGLLREREKQGRLEELVCSQDGGTEQRVGLEHVGLTGAHRLMMMMTFPLVYN